MRLKTHIWLFLAVSLFLTNIASASSTLLVMGDSLSAGYNLRPEADWVSLLEEQLSQSHPDVQIVNASVSGETSQGGLSRFDQLLSEFEPRWVIIELGANDALRGYPLDETTKNLETMVEKAHQIDAKVLLVGNRLPQNYGKRYSDMFFQLYETVAAKHKLHYVPFMLEGVALNKSLMQDDGLHPNKAGQPRILENILPQLTLLLAD